MPEPAAQDDLELFGEVVRGDRKAYATLFRAYAAPLCHYAQRLVRSGAAAEDIVQEALYLLWERRESIKLSGSVRAYLYGTVRNMCVDELRKRNVRDSFEEKTVGNEAALAQLAGSNSSPGASAELNELNQKVAAIIQSLSPRVREVITLRLRDELTYSEIATALGVAQKTVEAQMAQALKALREALAGYKDTASKGNSNV